MHKKRFLLLSMVLVLSGCSSFGVENTSESSGTRKEISNSSRTADESRRQSRELPGKVDEADEVLLELNKETEHFKIYCAERDKECLDDLGKGLESAYSKVTADLNHTLDYKTDVKVYPDLQSLQAAVGLGGTGADDYMTAAALGKRIYLVSPLNPGPVRDYDHMVNSSTFHEFTHVAINDLTSSDSWPSQVPRWLNEGVACYEGGPPMPVEILKQQVAMRILAGTIPSFDDIAGYGSRYNEVCGYFFALPAGTFLIEKYGFEKVKQLILSPEDFKEILGISKQELWEEWNEYLKTNYK